MTKVLTIERSKWRRGGDSPEMKRLHGHTYLLNNKGMMCCLGFDALACGVPAKEIEWCGEPVEIQNPEQYPTYVERRLEQVPDDECDGAVWRQRDAIVRAINHNDDCIIDDATRERLIRVDLMALGWDDVVFVD